MTDWQPIETAPKGRTPVLVWWDGRIVGEARYIPEEDADDFGWWWANEDPGDYHAERLSPEPTHWMPLPAPPTVAQPANTDSVPGSPLRSGARPDQPKLPESGGIVGSSIGLGAEGEQ